MKNSKIRRACTQTGDYIATSFSKTSCLLKPLCKMHLLASEGFCSACGVFYCFDCKNGHDHTKANRVPSVADLIPIKSNILL